MDEQFKNVEKILSTFPESARKNYYTNKETLEIVGVDSFNASTLGSYDCEENKLKLLDNSVLEHELFHMAFNNREKFLKEIQPGIYLDNGVAYQKSGISGIQGLGLTEGFAESLAIRAKAKASGREFQAYIVELLVSIYGEDIYRFPLENDPIGFYNYCSLNINDIRYFLDMYTETLSYLGDIMEFGIDKSGDISLVFYFIFQSIIETITYTIREYNSSLSPKVSKTEFKCELMSLFRLEEISLVSALLNQLNINLEQEIRSVIDTELISKKYIKK